jgi:hypothetical protein
MTPFIVAGVAAGVLSLIDPIPYIRDTLRGLTRPHRGTWLIWSVLGAIAFASQLADGASWSLAMVGVQTVSMSLIFVLSLWFGIGGVSRFDLTLMGVAGLGIVGWAVSAEPVVATAFVVVADAVGAVLMLPKTWRDPWSETFSTFALAGGSGFLSAVAVGALDGGLLLYPVYFGVVNGGLAALIAYRRRALAVPAVALTGAPGTR